jgi:hypothetical protein
MGAAHMPARKESPKVQSQTFWNCQWRENLSTKPRIHIWSSRIDSTHSCSFPCPLIQGITNSNKSDFHYRQNQSTILQLSFCLLPSSLPGIRSYIYYLLHTNNLFAGSFSGWCWFVWLICCERKTLLHGWLILTDTNKRTGWKTGYCINLKCKSRVNLLNTRWELNLHYSP